MQLKMPRVKYRVEVCQALGTGLVWQGGGAEFSTGTVGTVVCYSTHMIGFDSRRAVRRPYPRFRFMESMWHFSGGTPDVISS